MLFFLMIQPPPTSTLFPYTTLFRSGDAVPLYASPCHCPQGVSLRRAGRLDHGSAAARSEEHTSELQSRLHLVCRLLLEKKKKTIRNRYSSPHRRTLNTHHPVHAFRL